MIREIQETDVAACISIVKENWGDKVAAKFVKEVQHTFMPWMEWPPIYYVYTWEKEVVAFAGMIPSWLCPDTWDLIWINVQKYYQHDGIGTKLTKHRINEIEKRNGKLIHLMTQHRDFYSRMGFKDGSCYTPDDWRLMYMQLGDIKL